MRDVFIIGSKGIPANYGGFETFVDELVSNQKSNRIKYHVSCLSNNDKEFDYKGARCFNVSVPNIGAAKAVYYDIIALKKCLKYIEENNIHNAIIYILACRIGPFIPFFKSKMKKLNVEFLLNPDGHEWKRAKWNALIRQYWKLSERLMVKDANLIICDSKNIESYIQADYQEFSPVTRFIAYGANLTSNKDRECVKFTDWCRAKGVVAGEYYLVVGRFVPENNYDLMIREFMKSNTKKDFVIITNIEKNKFYDQLLKDTKFIEDSRIKFVGTVYDSELLSVIRENAYGYLHGHEVGGTNPSLLEALATTKLNLLLEVGFNREVAENSALYFSKKDKDLANLINYADELSPEVIEDYGKLAKERIYNEYSWQKIVNEYESVFEEVRKF